MGGWEGEGGEGERGRGAAKGGAPKGGALKGGMPMISRFFSLSHHSFHSFLPSLVGPFVEFWWCFEARGPSNVHVWSSRAVV